MSLWTPQGEVNLSKGVVPITRNEVVMLSRLHEFAQKHGITVTCQRCDSAILGKNTGEGNSAALACRCREFLYRE